MPFLSFTCCRHCFDWFDIVLVVQTIDTFIYLITYGDWAMGILTEHFKVIFIANNIHCKIAFQSGSTQRLKHLFKYHLFIGRLEPFELSTRL